MPTTVTGTYRALDPYDPYWGESAGAGPGARLSDGAIFTPLATFAALGPNRVEVSLDLIATPAAYRDTDATTVAARAQRGALVLGTEGVRVTSGLPRLTERLGDEQRLVVNGVVIGVGELLVVCWLALFLAVRRTAEARRADIGLLKLRGLRRRDLWLVVAGQSLPPLLVGGLAGLALGPVLARWLAGGAQDPPSGLTAAAAGVAVLGAAAVALAAERRTLGESVASLGRRVGRPRLGRLAILDAVVVLLALAGAYQATSHGSAGAASGVALLAPLLLALAVGVAANRLVPMAANRVGGRALRSGRLGRGLSALHLARRTGTAGVLGVVVVVVAVLTATTLSWSVAAAAREQRAVAEVGAGRVLTVQAPGPHELLAAVRSADPEGTRAMAAVRTSAPVGTVLAVDTTRLGAVAPALAAYGLPDWAALAAALHPAGYAPVTVRTATLTVDATWAGPAPEGMPTGAVTLDVRLVGADGAPVEASTGALRAGRHRYALPVPACAGGCRLVALTLADPLSTVDISGSASRVPYGSTLTLHALDTGGAQDGPGPLADRTRWRATLTDTGQAPDITVTPEGLRLGIGPGVPPATTALAATAYVADAPSPLPVLRAGEIGLDRDPRTAVVGADVVPVRVVASGRALPGVGPGLLADLEYADRLATQPREATLQVWLADTPDAGAVLDRLARAGVTVVADDSIAARRSALDARGPATAQRFLLAVGLVLLALGLLTFAVAAAAERRVRAVELAALRRQGLPARVVRRAALVGYPALGLLAVGLGAVTGVLVDRLVPAPLPIFSDGYAELAAPAAPPALLLAAAAAALAVTGVALAAGAGLVAAVRRGTGAAPWSG